MNTQNYEFDFLVFIGRFQPFHVGHLKVVEEGLKRARRLIVLVGSSHRPRCPRNPWTLEERQQMIRESVAKQDQDRLSVEPLMDSTYNDDAWMRNVQQTVQGIVAAHHSQPHRPARVGLIGHKKDESSYYLNLFPQWGSVPVANYQGLSATHIRDALFAGDIEAALDNSNNSLPVPVQHQLRQFAASEVCNQVVEEVSFVQKYRSAWANAPYAPTFVTVDAVVIQSGHILLVERKAQPGKGLMALPGGFINPQERIEDACIRELREETRLKVPVPVLKGGIEQSAVFDDPYRSARGRTITHAFLITLKPEGQLPKVKGGDDAKAARWVPLAELNPKQMFEDHYFIIQQMVGM